MTRGELKQYQAIVREIKGLTEEIRQLRAEAARYRSPDGQPHSNYQADRTAALVAAIADLGAELTSRQAELIRQRKKIERWIYRLAPREREIIRLYYLLGLPWGEVAEQTRYSIRQVLRIHNETLGELPAE